MDNSQIVFNQFCGAMNIDPKKDYIITYKSELTDPNCLTLEELKFLFDTFKSLYPSSHIYFIPDSLEIKEYNIEDLIQVRDMINELIKEREG